MQPRTFRFRLLQQNCPVARSIVSFDLIFTDEAPGQLSETNLSISFSIKSFRLSEDNLSRWSIFRNRSSFQSYSFLNQLNNELLTVNLWLMKFESKLSNSASAISECRSENLDDRGLNPVKNLSPSPFVQSSLLSLV